MKTWILFLCLTLLFCQCQKEDQSLSDDRDFQPRTIRVTSGQSSRAMVISMGGQRAVQAGLDTLTEGGNALDAVLASSMTHIVSTIGMAVSFAGTSSLLYYEAKTGQVYSLNAPFKIPLRETNPLTIPRRNSGRTALVPGFLAGVLTAHRQWGRIPLERIFAPAIRLAEDGFHLPAWMASAIRDNYPILSRLPETKQIFTKSDGTLYDANELFTQTGNGLPVPGGVGASLCRYCQW
jgi:gamma-glutamyltranspeptidase/glutathione hydrolase